MNKDLMFSSQSTEWETPQALFDQLNAEFGFTLDPCATHENALCKKYYTKTEDGLAQDWTGEIVYCNPPYGRNSLPRWIKKCHDEAEKGVTVVMLIPARTDTRAFHRYIYGKAEIRFIQGRIRFGAGGICKNAAPFPSMIAIFRNQKEIRQ